MGSPPQYEPRAMVIQRLLEFPKVHRLVPEYRFLPDTSPDSSSAAPERREFMPKRYRFHCGEVLTEYLTSRKRLSGFLGDFWVVGCTRWCVLGCPPGGGPVVRPFSRPGGGPFFKRSKQMADEQSYWVFISSFLFSFFVFPLE